MTVTGVTKIRDRGVDSLNFNIVFVAEGFTSAEQAAFQSAATTFVNDLFAFEPFATEVSANINVHRLDVESVDSGTTLTCGGGAGNTDFLAEVCSGGLDRLITVDNGLVIAAADTWVPEWDVMVVVVNNSEYGGSGATDVAVYSTGTSTTVPIHELGHSGFGLADEYEYWAGCASGETTRQLSVRGTVRTERHDHHRSGDDQVGPPGRRGNSVADDVQPRLHPVRHAAEPGAGWDGRRLRGRPLLPLRCLPTRV